MLGISLTRDRDALGSDQSTITSFIDLGTTTTTSTREGTNAGIIKFNDNEYYWKAPLNGIWIGTNESKKFGLNKQEVTIETGTQCTYVPEDFYETVLEHVLDYSTGYYFTDEGDVVVDCGDVNNMKTIRLLVND